MNAHTPHHREPVATTGGPRLRRIALVLCAVPVLALAALPAQVGAQKSQAKDATALAAAADAMKLPARLWRDPGDLASLDLTYGAGGKAHAPDLDGTFTFVKEDTAGTSAKFDVTDAQGVEWKVKLGSETQCETVATRFLWAAGYFVDEDYYVADLPVRGLPTLNRGQDHVSHGVAHGARLERKLAGVKKVGTWDWLDNPFAGQREFNGLRVMMSFLNNWDLKTVNNTVQVVDGERRYMVSDVGATFGTTGGAFSRTKGDPKDYEESKFIAKVTPDFIDFVQKGKMQEVTKHIPRADAKWLGMRLSKLSDAQIRDAFRAGGYAPGDIDNLTRTVRQRIAALEAL
jgi:hypothetical protein